MPFLLVRHGHVDYEQFPGRFRGHGIDLLPLSPRGLSDVEAVIPTLRRPSIDLIISSPMTRALQTAMILSRETAASVEVEMHSHEWVPDRTQRWSGQEVRLPIVRRTAPVRHVLIALARVGRREASSEDEILAGYALPHT